MSFASHAQDQACGSSNITLNGVYLHQEWNGDFASGSGSYQGLTDLTQNEWFLQRDLDLEWETACLHATEETEAAQVVTVNIKAIDGKAIDSPTIDTPQALLLRREPKANVERYDDLRARSSGGRHAS